MATPKVREDLMRAESKKPSNKSCVDCGKPGPHSTVVLAPDTYFFVCQPCGGQHRSITHKVKTVGMTDFTPAEVEQVQKGGNKEGKRFWHARLPEMPFTADLNDPKNLAQFIKLTFVDKKYIPADGQRPPPAPKRVAAPKSELKRTHTGLPTTHVAAPLSTPGTGHHGGSGGAPPPSRDILSGLESFEFTEAPVEPGAPAAATTTPATSASYVQPPLTAIHTPSYTQPPLTAIHKPGPNIAVGTSSPAPSSNTSAVSSSPAPSAAAPPPGFAASAKISVPSEAVDQLSRGFSAIVTQHKLTPLQLYAAVHQAMTTTLGPHMANLATALAPHLATSVTPPPQPAAAATLAPPVSSIPAPSTPNGNTFSASGGFPDFEMTSPVSSPATTAAPTTTAATSSAPTVVNVLDDPLAGIGETSRRDSGNPFDDDDDVIPTPASLQQHTPPISVIGPNSAMASIGMGNGNGPIAAPVTAIHNRKASFGTGFDPLQGLPTFDGPAPTFDAPKPPQPAPAKASPPPAAGASGAFGMNAFGNGVGADNRPRGYSNAAGQPPVGGVGLPGMVPNPAMGGMATTPVMGNPMMGMGMNMNMGMATSPVIVVGYDQYGQPIYQPNPAAAGMGAFGMAPGMMPGGYPGAATGAFAMPPAGAFGGYPTGSPPAAAGAFGAPTGAFAVSPPASAVPTVATPTTAAAPAPKRPELFSFLNPLS